MLEPYPFNADALLVTLDAGAVVVRDDTGLLGIGPTLEDALDDYSIEYELRQLLSCDDYGAR